MQKIIDCNKYTLDTELKVSKEFLRSVLCRFKNICRSLIHRILVNIEKIKICKISNLNGPSY